MGGAWGVGPGVSDLEGLAEGEWDGERLEARGEEEEGGGDVEHGGVAMRAGSGRDSPLPRWKKLSMLLLRMTDLKDRERFNLCSWTREQEEAQVTNHNHTCIDVHTDIHVCISACTEQT